MKQYTLKLDNTRQRPVVILNNGLTALLDTGAYIPVWTDDEDILTSELGAELVRKDVPLSGFGGCTHGNLYKVNIDIGGILYPNMHVIANNEINATFNLILSATMFEGLIYQIDTVNHVLNSVRAAVNEAFSEFNKVLMEVAADIKRNSEETA